MAFKLGTLIQQFRKSRNRSGELFITGAMLTHQGQVRDNNEDAVRFVLPVSKNGKPKTDALFIVADGMGGASAGEIASHMAVEAISSVYFAKSTRPVPKALANAFYWANSEIYKDAKNNPEHEGMGTTCTVLAIRNNLLWLGHIGDSRAYLVRRGLCSKISKDHTLVGDMVRQGIMSAEQAAVAPNRNIVTKVLGTSKVCDPDIWKIGGRLMAGDVLVVCSDGLSDVVTKDTIAQIAKTKSAQGACDALVQSALDAGAPDNISVGVVKIDAEPIEATSCLNRPTVLIPETSIVGGQPGA